MKNRLHTTHVHLLLLSLGLLLSTHVAGHSQTTNVAHRLQRMVITGTNEPCYCLSREELTKIPGGVDVITAGEFRTGRASTMKDVLEYSPGVFVQPRFGSDEARLSIRGSGLQRTFHGRGLMLLQDGLPVNLADGAFDMQAIEPLAVSHVEVFRGGNALRYGSTTLGGAINYVTPTGYDAPRVTLRLEGGSFDYLHAQAASGGVRGKFDYYASATHSSTDGFREHAQQNAQRVFANFGVRFSEHLDTRLYFTYVQTYSELPGSLTKVQLESDPRQANAGNVALDQQRNFELTRVASRTTWQRDGGELEFNAWWSHKDLDHPIFQVIDQNSNDLGADARYRNRAELGGRRNELTVGFRPTYGWIEDFRFLNVGGNRGALRGESTQTSYNLDAYAEDQHWISDKFSVVAGAQFSYASRKFEDRYLADGNQTDEQDFTGFNPKVGARYEFASDAQVYFNVSRSFEPPSFGELVRPPTTATNTVDGLVQLAAQSAWTVELGTRGERGRVAWDVTAYYAWVSDELLSFSVPVVGAPTNTFTSLTVNADKTIHAGVELGGAVRLLENIFSGERDGQHGDALTWRAAYQWNHFRFADDPVFGDNQLPGIPEHYLRTELMYEHRCGFYAGPNVEWSPCAYPVDMANTLFADSYALLGVKLGYRSARGFSAFFEARNLTDERYAATTGVITRFTGGNGAQFLPGDGRAFYGGIEWKF